MAIPSHVDVHTPSTSTPTTVLSHPVSQWKCNRRAIVVQSSPLNKHTYLKISSKRQNNRVTEEQLLNRITMHPYILVTLARVIRRTFSSVVYRYRATRELASGSKFHDGRG